MNQKVHVFGIIVNYFQVIPEAFMVWLWLPLVLVSLIEWVGEEREDD